MAITTVHGAENPYILHVLESVRRALKAATSITLEVDTGAGLESPVTQVLNLKVEGFYWVEDSKPTPPPPPGTQWANSDGFYEYSGPPVTKGGE